MRAEKTAREAAIFDEIETHNALLGDTGKYATCDPMQVGDDRVSAVEPPAAEVELTPEPQAALRADLAA